MLICGKGGSGKSTLTALLAQHYEQTGKDVVVVDTDESNIGLHRFLGVSPPTDLMDQMGGKKEMMGKMMSAMKNPDPVFLQFIYTQFNIVNMFEHSIPSGLGVSVFDCLVNGFVFLDYF